MSHPEGDKLQRLAESDRIANLGLGISATTLPGEWVLNLWSRDDSFAETFQEVPAAPKAVETITTVGMLANGALVITAIAARAVNALQRYDILHGRPE